MNGLFVSLAYLNVIKSNSKESSKVGWRRRLFFLFIFHCNVGGGPVEGACSNKIILLLKCYLGFFFSVSFRNQ